MKARSFILPVRRGTCCRLMWWWALAWTGVLSERWVSECDRSVNTSDATTTKLSEHSQPSILTHTNQQHLDDVETCVKITFHLGFLLWYTLNYSTSTAETISWLTENVFFINKVWRFAANQKIYKPNNCLMEKIKIKMWKKLHWSAAQKKLVSQECI